MKLHHWIPPLLCAVLFATSSLAEEQTVEELPWYEVEIIIFTRDLQPANLNEAWPTDPGVPDFDNAQPLQPDMAGEIQPDETLSEEGIEHLNSDSDAALPTIPSAITDENSTLKDALSTPDTTDVSELPVPVVQRLPVAYALILEDDYKLKTEFNRLQRNNGLQPVVHLAWRQPVTDQKHAKLIYLRTPDTSTETEIETAATTTIEAETISGFENIAITEPPNLEGTIRVSVNRYLHVELDLLSRTKQSALYSSYERPFEDPYIQQPQTYNRYRMQAHRRMRSGELHYIDHPLMGALVKITPFELPKPIPIAPIEPEATENPAAEPPTQIEGGVTAEPNKGTTTEQEVAPTPQEQGTTTSTIEIPARSRE